ncbi:MAG TPA: PA domain-containing protein [Gemmatimonadaceae bacterium]|nr:PA domain-containing protein [Gemmatimonadaceae bacterium]
MMAFPATMFAQGFRLVGHSDLGGEGLNGDVTVVGSTAIVAAGMMPAGGVHAHLYNPYPCPAVSVKLVDMSRPQRPVVVGRIPVPAGLAAHGVAAARVATASFTGDLLAVALTVCGSGGSSFERGIAYYDISRPATPHFLGRYQADADMVKADSIPPCGAPPAKSGDRCASSQHSVSLVQRPDGRVLSLSLEPGASASKQPSGDLRIVDVTDPRNPVQVGSFPPAGRPIFSTNGCRPFNAGHGAGFSHGGGRGLLAFYDGGVFVLDLAGSGKPSQLGQFSYPADRRMEASAAYVAAAKVDGRDLALISEADFIAPTTTLEVSGPPTVAGSKFGCEAVFTLYDKSRKAQLYRQPGSSLQADLAYLGRGCPRKVPAGADMHSDMSMQHGDSGSSAADPYPADPTGKIALVDRGRQTIQSTLPNVTCSIAERVRRAQDAGARGVIILQTSTAAPEAFSPDGDASGISIPVMMIDKQDGDALRSALCPSLRDGRCAGGVPVLATMRDSPGEWGALRVVDITDPAKPHVRGLYRTPRSKAFPPRDLSVFSPQRAAVHGHMAIVPWNSDGARVIDLSAGAPREVASFVPPDRADPTGVLPAKAYVVSVALLSEPDGTRSSSGPRYVIVSDINSGIYVLTSPWPRRAGPSGTVP